MNEVTRSPLSSKERQAYLMSKNKLTKKSWQHVLLIGACSLALSASSVACIGYLERTQASALARATSSDGAAPLHRQQSLVNHQQSQLIHSQTRNVADFNPIARPTAPTGSITSQPSVYHSIIDQTDAPSIRRASPAIQTSVATTAGDLNTAAGHHHGHAHGKYYEYRAVPKKKTWKFGYKRGNHKHTISRHEHGKAGKHPHFKTKVKWHDKKSKGKGIHLWDYNHHDKKHYHHG